MSENTGKTVTLRHLKIEPTGKDRYPYRISDIHPKKTNYGSNLMKTAEEAVATAVNDDDFIASSLRLR